MTLPDICAALELLEGIRPYETNRQITEHWASAHTVLGAVIYGNGGWTRYVVRRDVIGWTLTLIRRTAPPVGTEEFLQKCTDLGVGIRA